MASLTDTDSRAVYPEGQCFRCGYDLRGIANDRPCPECGLLAQRSRRLTDELHNSRPRWLRSISLGVRLILLALLVGVGVPLLASVMDAHRKPDWRWLARWMEWGAVAAVVLSAALLAAGAFLLTRPEGYPPADHADRRRRILVRMVASCPLLAMALAAPAFFGEVAGAQVISHLWILQLLTLLAIVLAAGSFFLPLLLFLQLRGLAYRARSADLAEHCGIVSVGGSVALAYAGAVIAVIATAAPDSPGPAELTLILLLILGVCMILFLLWALYLLTCFAVSFHRASRQLRKKWRRDDRAVAQ